MIFLTQSDLDFAIKAENLQPILNANVGILDAAVMYSIKEMQSHLNRKYDVAKIFSQEGDDRNELVVMYAVDITLYHLHTRVTTRQPIENRLFRYNEAIKWLKDVVNGNVDVKLPLLEISDNNDTSVTWGSRRPFRYE